MCKSGFLGFVHRLYFNKLQRLGSRIFFRIQVKKWLAQPGGPTARVFVLPFFLPEDGRRSSFRNVVILLKYRRWTESKEPLLQIIALLSESFRLYLEMLMF
jgi:hypothetical protein